MVAALGGSVGSVGPVGLDEVALKGRMWRTPLPGRAAVLGLRWRGRDQWSRTWWPQGISTPADAGRGDSRPVLTSWYAKPRAGVHLGSRLSVVDVESGRFAHVLLVEPVLDGDLASYRPLKVHAGGLVWAGDWVHVTGTRAGLVSAHLGDLLRVPPGGRTDRVGRSGSTWHAAGASYLLPVRARYEAVTDEGHEPLRYSFASLDRTGEPTLVAGEYGGSGMTTRLVHYPLGADGRLSTSESGVCLPTLLDPGGVGHMQGATVVRGRWYVTVSRGRFRRGDVYAGRPGALSRHACAGPPGVEDLSHWPDRLWSVSEWPGMRWVFAMERAAFD